MNTEDKIPDLEIVIAEVKRRQNEIAANIRWLETLRSRTLSPDVQVLLRYLVCGEPMRVAAWANNNGWKFKPSVGNRRAYKANDVLALLAIPPEDWSPELVAFVKECCFDECGMRNTGKLL